MIEIKRQKDLIKGGERKRELDFCAQVSYNEKEVLNLRVESEWRKIKVNLKIKDSSHIENCAFKV